MNTERQAAEYISLAQGKGFWLDSLEDVYQVWEGDVEVFAITGEHSRQRRQIFLFEAGPGQTLFTLPPSEIGGGVRLMVVAQQTATLKNMTRTSIIEQVGSDKRLWEVIWFMIEEWLEALLPGPGAGAPPMNFCPLDRGQTLAVDAKQAVRAGQGLTWIQAVTGEIRYGIMDDYVLAADMAVPLLQRVWVTAGGAANIRGLSTEEVFPSDRGHEPAVFWRPLQQCHQLFVDYMAEYFASESRRESDKVAARRQQREKLLHGSAVHLLQTAMPDLPPVITPDTTNSPLLTVVRAVAVHLGIPEQQVRLPAGSHAGQQDGVLLRGIVRLAGMQIRQVRLETGWQLRDNGPLLGYWRQDGQPAALLPASPSQYRLYDSAGRDCGVVTAEIAAALAVDAYAFYAALPEKSSSLGGWLKFMLGKCWSGDIWTVVLASMAAGMIPILAPFVTQTIFDDIIPVNDRQGHVMVVQVMMVAAFAAAGVSVARTIAVMRVKSKSRLAAEAALWLRLLSLPAGFFRRYQAGDLAQRLNAITQIATLLSGSAVATVFNVLFSFWSLLAMVYYSWQLALAATLVLGVYFVTAGLLAWQLVAAKRKMMTAMGQTAGKVLQVFNGLSKFRMQGAETQAFYLWAREFGEQWKWNREARMKTNWLELINTIQPVLLSMLVFWLTTVWLEAGGKETTAFISQPEFLGFNAALTGFNVAIIGLASMLEILLDIVPQIERIRPILEAEPEVTEDKAEMGTMTGQIEINNVSFRYSPDTPLVLRNVSLTVQPGQFIAVVGGSGSGKSTLLRLLLGFEKPESGSVYFDGQDLGELNVASVRSQMGVVLQNGQLMSGDIFNNIVGSLPLTTDDAWRAAEMVGLADDIREMPMGMNTVVSEGATNISGGQRQRILIARSIVNRPRIIIFDEATSALDNQTQAIVTASMDKLKATRIVVAHRLSTIINADVIYVMDKGQLVESGTYEELMEINGLFAALARRQMA